jgi:hypothetical protein
MSVPNRPLNPVYVGVCKKMTRKPGGHNNSIKHGAFAQDMILPDENSEDFERLHQSLIEEWKPKGGP